MKIRCKTAVVILAWNGKEYLRRYLPSVLAYSQDPGTQVVVIDNCSADDTAAMMQELFPQVAVVTNRRNGGYAGGYNDGLMQIDAEYWVLLNQDVAVTEGWLRRPVAMMDADSRLGAVQPKILDDKNQRYFEYAGACGGMMDWLGYPFCRGRVFETIEQDEHQYEQEQEIFWTSGACMLVRRKAFEEAGKLDEWFFAHMEEIDLCWRMQALGYRLMVCPSSVVYHLGGGSLPYGSSRKVFLNFRNNLSMLIKNLPVGILLYTLPIRIILDWVAALQALVVRKSVQDAKAILRAQGAVMLQLPYLFRQRRQIKQKTAKGLQAYSILYRYFIRGQRTYSELKGKLA